MHTHMYIHTCTYTHTSSNRSRAGLYCFPMYDISEQKTLLLKTISGANPHLRSSLMSSE